MICIEERHPDTTTGGEFNIRRCVQWDWALKRLGLGSTYVKKCSPEALPDAYSAAGVTQGFLS